MPQSCPAAAKNLSLFLLWAAFSTCTATARVLGLAEELWCLREHSWELRWGWGPENAEAGFSSLCAVCCWDPASPQGREVLSCCYETHLRKGLFHSPITTALTCCGGIPALCQAGESRDAELPSPPNIKGNEAVPMELILLSGHRNISPELPFEEAGSEV